MMKYIIGFLGHNTIIITMHYNDEVTVIFIHSNIENGDKIGCALMLFIYRKPPALMSMCAMCTP